MILTTVNSIFPFRAFVIIDLLCPMSFRSWVIISFLQRFLHSIFFQGMEEHGSSLDLLHSMSWKDMGDYGLSSDPSQYLIRTKAIMALHYIFYIFYPSKTWVIITLYQIKKRVVLGALGQITFNLQTWNLITAQSCYSLCQPYRASQLLSKQILNKISHSRINMDTKAVW